jgi:hypothetical protein
MAVTNLLVQSPNPGFRAINGTPIEDGKIYIGEDGLDAEANPVIAYWDDALTQVATQPVRTLGGYPSNGGVIGSLYVADNYSVTVRNKDDSLVSSIINGGIPLIILADLNTVAGISDEIVVVAGISGQVVTLANISTDITDVADNNADISTCAADIVSIIAAPTSAANAAISAADAAADAISTAADVVTIDGLLGASGQDGVFNGGDLITGTDIQDGGWLV